MTTSTLSAELKELKIKVDLLQLQQEENLSAVNDLSEDVRKDIDNLYSVIGELASEIEEKKNNRASALNNMLSQSVTLKRINCLFCRKNKVQHSV